MIHPQSKNELDKHLFKGCNIVELGDQFCDWSPEVQGIRTDTYFKEHGIEIKSVDWHGKNGALKIDLSEISTVKLKGDIVTDFGTLEHVKDTYNCLVNCFSFCKIGGKMIHVNPDKTYVKHGYFYFTEKFWHEYAKLAKLEVISIYTEKPYDKTNPASEVYAVLKKTDKSRIVSEQEFEGLQKYLGEQEQDV